jgi:hypothetical protein
MAPADVLKQLPQEERALLDLRVGQHLPPGLDLSYASVGGIQEMANDVKKHGKSFLVGLALAIIKAENETKRLLPGANLLSFLAMRWLTP